MLTFQGVVTNHGNLRADTLQARLSLLVNGHVVREVVSDAIYLPPLSSLPVQLSVELRDDDPPGPVTAEASLMTLVNRHLVQRLASGPLGTIQVKMVAPIPAPVLAPRSATEMELINTVTTAVLDTAAVDANNNLTNPQEYVNNLATALEQNGITFREPDNAQQIADALAATIPNQNIENMPVLESNSHLATPPEASTTGVVLVPGPESSTDRVEIIFPVSGGWPDVTQFPNGTEISLTGAGYVATLPG